MKKSIIKEYKEYDPIKKKNTHKINTKMWTAVIISGEITGDYYFLFYVIYFLHNCPCIQCSASKTLWSLPEADF